MEKDWRSDAQLHIYGQLADECELFSFDIFDTLLFRRCERPVDVFALTAERASVRFPDFSCTPAEYTELRRAAEQAANRKNAPVHKYENIFAELDFPKDVLDFLQREEIETEKQVIFLNPPIYSLIRYLHRLGKTVVLVSDMYHSRRTICVFLAKAGVDIGIFSGVYISSEYCCYKGDGRLFRRMLEDYPKIAPSLAVHIGDSENADCVGAQRAGMKAILYRRME